MDLKIPIKNEEGKVTLEDWNPDGEQSDGSRWFKPQKLVAEDHKHYFKLKNPSDRKVECECGWGGDFYPHNAVLKNGHIYNLEGKRVI